MQTMHPMISTSTGRVPVFHILPPFCFPESPPDLDSIFAGSLWIIILPISAFTIWEHLSLSERANNPTKVHEQDVINLHEYGYPWIHGFVISTIRERRDSRNNAVSLAYLGEILSSQWQKGCSSLGKSLLAEGLCVCITAVVITPSRRAPFQNSNDFWQFGKDVWSTTLVWLRTESDHKSHGSIRGTAHTGSPRLTYPKPFQKLTSNIFCLGYLKKLHYHLLLVAHSRSPTSEKLLISTALSC